MPGEAKVLIACLRLSVSEVVLSADIRRTLRILKSIITVAKYNSLRDLKFPEPSPEAVRI